MTDKPDLRRVLSFYGVELHSQRREQSVNCPVHEESRPSCSVNEDDGLWHCLACGAAGDSWSLIMLKEGFDEFRSAVQFAEQEFGGSYAQGKPDRRTGGRRERGAGFRPAFKRQRILS